MAHLPTPSSTSLPRGRGTELLSARRQPYTSHWRALRLIACPSLADLGRPTPGEPRPPADTSCRESFSKVWILPRPVHMFVVPAGQPARPPPEEGSCSNASEHRDLARKWRRRPRSKLPDAEHQVALLPRQGQRFTHLHRAGPFHGAHRHGLHRGESYMRPALRKRPVLPARAAAAPAYLPARPSSAHQIAVPR